MTDQCDEISEVSLKGHLIIIDDDEVLLHQTCESYGKERLWSQNCFSVADGIKIAATFEPEFAVVDLRLAGWQRIGSCRQVERNCRRLPDHYDDCLWQYCDGCCRVKAGAIDYLAKPADADMIEKRCFKPEKKAFPSPPYWPYVCRSREMGTYIACLWNVRSQRFRGLHVVWECTAVLFKEFWPNMRQKSKTSHKPCPPSHPYFLFMLLLI